MSKNRKKILFFSLFLVINVIFIDFVSAEKYNNYSSEVVSCGNGLISSIPTIFPNIVNIIYIIIQIAVPVLLVIFGMLDLVKGIIASKEDEIKKGQQMLIKRTISAALVFFVFALVKVVVSLASDNSNIMGCAECFINKKCDVEKKSFVCNVDNYAIAYDSNGKLENINILACENSAIQRMKSFLYFSGEDSIFCQNILEPSAIVSA